MWWSCWIVFWFNLLYCIALVCTVLLQCVGKVEVPGQTCINTYMLVIGASIINVVTDIAMLIIPLVAVWNLHMQTKKKIGLTLVFLVGTLATLSSLARLIWQALRASDPNKTVALIVVALLAIAEHAVGLIVGCMPVLPALYNHVFRKRGVESESWKQSYSNKQTYSQGSGGYRHSRSAKIGSRDPYLISKQYTELDDMEQGHRRGKSKGTTTTTIEAGDDRNSSFEQTFEALNGHPHTNALVSRSIQIDTRTRSEPSIDGSPTRMQPAFVKL